MRRHLWASLALAPLLAAGCERPGTGPLVHPTAVVTGHCRTVPGGEPVAGARVALLGWPSLAVLATADSDSTGAFSLELPAPVTVLPAAWHPTLQLFHLPQLARELPAGSRQEIGLGLSPAPPLEDSGLELVGTVVDDSTGQAIAGAVVEMTWLTLTELLPELAGRFPPLRTISGPGGGFVLSPLPELPGLDGRDRTPHWRVLAPGYRSAWFAGFVDGGVPPRYEVRLRRGSDPGVVEGSVRDLAGDPVAGIELRADWRRGDGALFRQVVPGAVATTDSLGRYRLEGLPLGGHWIAAGATGDDGWTTSGTQVDLSVAAPGATLPALPVSRALGGESPAGGDSLDWARGFGWDPFPGAASYRIRLRDAAGGGGAIGDLPGPAWVPTGLEFPLRGPVLWSAEALDAAGELLSASDRQQACVVGPPGNP